jgi:hypothetical protein
VTVAGGCTGMHLEHKLGKCTNAAEARKAKILAALAIVSWCFWCFWLRFDLGEEAKFNK